VGQIGSRGEVRWRKSYRWDTGACCRRNW